MSLEDEFPATSVALTGALTRLSRILNDQAVRDEVFRSLGRSELLGGELSETALEVASSFENGTEDPLGVVELTLLLVSAWNRLKSDTLFVVDPAPARTTDTLFACVLHSGVAEGYRLLGLCLRVSGIYEHRQQTGFDWIICNESAMNGLLGGPAAWLLGLPLNAGGVGLRSGFFVSLAEIFALTLSLPFVAPVDQGSDTGVSFNLVPSSVSSGRQQAALIIGLSSIQDSRLPRGFSPSLLLSVAASGVVSDADGAVSLRGSTGGRSVGVVFGTEAPYVLPHTDFSDVELRGEVCIERVLGRTELVSSSWGQSSSIKLHGTKIGFRLRGVGGLSAMFDVRADRFEFVWGVLRLSIRAILFSLSSDSATRPQNVPTFSLSLSGGSVLLDFANGDSFVSRESRGSSTEIPFELSVRRIASGAVEVSGGVRLSKRLSVGLDFGFLSIESVCLDLQLSTQGFVATIASVVLLRLSVIRASVVGIGVRLSAQEASPKPGNCGFLQTSVSFAPPTGISLSLDSGVVLGSGFISYDDETKRYAGGVSLTVFELGVRAVGVLDCDPPGVNGYSFLIMVLAEFSPIQLGFGFTLNAVGGLCGVQRTANIDALQRGLRDRSLFPVLFFPSLGTQANRLIVAVSAVFPITEDSYVFGLLFRFGWGTPTLVVVTLGLIVRLPDPVTFTLVGQVEVRLPKPEAAIVEVNIDILGLLLPDEKLLSIDARLRDSKVAGWTLTGGMAFRLTWGAEPNFLFSVGGFNPHFKPPPSFPQIERLALALGTGTNPRVSLAAYFAITSNSLQFGARAELYAEALGFSIQGYLEFHALFVFSPFSFRFDFAAGVALKRGSSVIAGITVAGTLSGPRPWRVQGSASISLIFFDVSVSFDETFGQPAEPERIEAVDAWAKLREALQDLRNWSAPLPVGSHRGVSTAADAETPARLCLDPLSGITLSQKVLPLEQRVSKLGEAPLEGGASVFRIARVRIGAGGSGGTLVDTAPHRDSFAAAQYQPLTDSERLSRPSYEPMIAGVETRADIARSGVVALVDRVWRTEYMRSDRHMEGPASPAAVALLLEMSSATGGGLSAAGLDRFASSPGSTAVVSMAPEMWIACSAEDLRAAGNQAPSSSYSTAAGVLGAMEHAGDSTENQVVPAWEAA